MSTASAGFARKAATRVRSNSLRATRALGHTGAVKLQKIAVSVPRRIAERARRPVREGRAASVSAYVADALEEKAKLDELAALLDEMLAASGGRLTAAERRPAKPVNFAVSGTRPMSSMLQWCCVPARAGTAS
jgi:Arc/MetJ-type ribon-helix-helix transcriptional regulator